MENLEERSKTILERLKSLHEFLESLKETSKDATYESMSAASGLTSEDISILISEGIIQKINIGKKKSRYIWNGILPNIRMAERLVSTVRKRSNKRNSVNDIKNHTLENLEEIKKPEIPKEILELIDLVSYVEIDDYFQISLNKDALRHDIINVDNLIFYLKSKII